MWQWSCPFNMAHPNLKGNRQIFRSPKNSAPLTCSACCSTQPVTYLTMDERLQYGLFYISFCIYKLWKLRQQMADAIIHIQVVGAGCLGDAVNDRTGLSIAHSVYYHPIPPANRKISQCAFTCRVINRHLSIR